jgi:hypothetical protein
MMCAAFWIIEAVMMVLEIPSLDAAEAKSAIVLQSAHVMSCHVDIHHQ